MDERPENHLDPRLDAEDVAMTSPGSPILGAPGGLERPRSNPGTESTTVVRSGALRLTYGTHHNHIRKARGRAAEYACVDCGKPAVHWAFNNTCPDRIFGNVGCMKGYRFFCPHVECYDPRCGPCHKRLDQDFYSRRENWRVAE